MTREAAIENIKLIRFNAAITNANSFKEALGMAIEALSRPSLPSNLDDYAREAALETTRQMQAYTNEPMTEYGFNLIREMLETAIHRGAEWIAEQFQKIEGELVDWYSTSDGKDYCCGVRSKDAFEVPEGFYIKKK